MSKCMKKSIIIEAVQYLNGETLFSECPEWLIKGTGNAIHYNVDKSGLAYIDTLEGVLTCKRGDWIIKGVKGEIYPCRDDIFKLTYDKVEND